MAKKTNSARQRMPAQATEGVEFPLDEENRRSTMGFNASVFAASVQGIDPDLAAKILQDAPKWRKCYSKYVMENVKVSAKSAKNAIAVADAGLDQLHDKMVFIRNERSMPLRTAMYEFKEEKIHTGFIKGRGSMPHKNHLEVPYKKKVLSGDDLRIQIDKWVKKGVIEVSCGAALSKVVDNDQWLELSDMYFVMLGASSAMGPFEFLLKHGANVVAVDIDRPKIWERLISTALASPGTLTFPLKSAQNSLKESELAAHSGCNLLTQTPEIRNWLCGIHKGKALAIGAYAYLDGGLFVKISVAMDAIVRDVVAARKGTSVAYLCTPTDVHIATAASAFAARRNKRASTLWQKLLSALSTRNHMLPNKFQQVQDSDGNTFHCIDAIVQEQGPNYILAKRLQHWRAIISRERGHIVSSNIAPSTRTLSVVHNVNFRMAYGGMPYFRPMEIFDQDTSSAVMAGLLIYDLKCPGSGANPLLNNHLQNPLCLFGENAFHGGVWRCGYKFSSIGTPAVLVYVVTQVMVPFYLVFYNSLQFVGWAGVGWKAISCFMEDDTDNIWARVRFLLRLCQDGAIIEVIHSGLGITSSPLFTTFLQIISRVAIVEGLELVPKAQDCIFIWGIIGAWVLTELVRYSFYSMKLLSLEIPLLTYLRYSLFIVLYPIGVMSEFFCVFSIIYSNSWTEGMKMLGLCIWYGLYLPNFPILFSHMLAQRKRILGPKQKVA